MYIYNITVHYQQCYSRDGCISSYVNHGKQNWPLPFSRCHKNHSTHKYIGDYLAFDQPNFEHQEHHLQKVVGAYMYLDIEKIPPFNDPKQDNATRRGTTDVNHGIAWLANVCQQNNK